MALCGKDQRRLVAKINRGAASENFSLCFIKQTKFMKKIYKSFCFKAPVIWCLKLAVDCNAAVERELSLMQYRPLCVGVIRVSF